MLITSDADDDADADADDAVAVADACHSSLYANATPLMPFLKGLKPTSYCWTNLCWIRRG